MTGHQLDLAGLDILADQLPISVTLLDLEDRMVRYSRNAPRFVKRTPDIIGRNVRNCHPPSSVATIDNILNEYQKGWRGEYAWKSGKEGVISTVRVGPF